MQSSKISTPKIFILLLILASALMASVFIVNIYNKPNNNNANNAYGTLFPTPRSIKPFELQTAKGKFTEKDLKGSYTLMFFGFTHCSNVCPTTLSTINKAYLDIKKTIPNLQVVLVSLDPERDDLATLTHYTQGFNKNFIGATGEMKALHKLQSQFGIYSEKQKSDDSNYQLQHTAYILLFNQAAQYAGLLRYGLSPQELTQALKNVKV